jgi:hypothetical protein
MIESMLHNYYKFVKWSIATTTMGEQKPSTRFLRTKTLKIPSETLKATGSLITASFTE